MADRTDSPQIFLTAPQVGGRYLRAGFATMLGGTAVVNGAGLLLAGGGDVSVWVRWGVVVLTVVCVLVGILLAVTGHHMRIGRWGLRIDGTTLTVLNGPRRAEIPWSDLEYFVVRRWGHAREVQVRFRPGVAPPPGFATGRRGAPGRPATDLTPLYQVSMLGDREAECVAALSRHLPRTV